MSILRTLSYGNFAKLWAAQIIALIASYLLNFALILTVYSLTEHTRYSTLSVSLVILAFTVPAFFASPMAGAYVDYWNRKRVMVWVNVLRTLLVLCLIPVLDNIVLILLLTLFISVITQFFIPAEAATIPRLVPKKYLLPANSLFVTSIYVTFILGYLATGPTISIFGSNGPFLATAVMFLAATALVAWLPKQPTHIRTRKLPSINPLIQLKINWKLVREVPGRYFSVMQIGLSQGLMYILITLVPALSASLLGGKLESNSYLLIIPVGIGMSLGIVIVNLLPKGVNLAKVIISCLISASLLLIVFGILVRLMQGHLVSHLGISIVATVVCLFGILNAMIATLAQTLLQYNTDDTNRGRVFGSLQMLINFGAALPIFIAGLLTDVLSVGWSLLIIGFVLFIYSASVASRWRSYS